jgi:hypothetical protein
MALITLYVFVDIYAGKFGILVSQHAMTVVDLQHKMVKNVVLFYASTISKQARQIHITTTNK